MSLEESKKPSRLEESKKPSVRLEESKNRHMAIFVAAHFSQAAFPAFFAGAGRPLLPSMIDYSVFSRSAAARGSIISGPVSRSATAFNFCIQGQIRLTRHLVIGRQVRRWWPTGGRVAS